MANGPRWLGLESCHFSCRNEFSRQQARRVRVCSCVPSSLIDICSRTNPTVPSSAREEQYALGYFPNWHSLPVPPYPADLRRGAGLYSEHKEQDYPQFLPHYAYSAPFDLKVTGDYSEHLTPHTCRFEIYGISRERYGNINSFMCRSLGQWITLAPHSSVS